MAKEQLDRTGLLLTQYKSFLDIYKQHFDLFLKGVLAYLASISVVAGLVFSNDIPKYSRISLSMLIPLASVVTLIGCIKSRRWVLDLQASIESIENELRLRRFPFSGPRGIILSIIVASIIFFWFGVINLVFQTIFL